MFKEAYRSIEFCNKKNIRYWWHHQTNRNYVPPVYDFLTDKEWRILEAWYEETDKLFPNAAGESCVPVLSLLQGIIMGNGIGNIIQCGHYHGYSTLLIGFFLKRMGLKKSFFSIDIDPKSTDFTSKWIKRAGLSDYVHLCTSDSASEEVPRLAKNYFQCEDINLIYIDSSHNYRHTIDEINLWFGELASGGFILIHDASVHASQFDGEKLGGVHRAIDEIKDKLANKATFLWINKNVESFDIEPSVFKDPCGIAIIQKL